VTPFLQFRLWARRAPAAERAATAVVALALLALVGYALVPVSTSGRTPTSAAAPATTATPGPSATTAGGAGAAASGGPVGGGTAGAPAGGTGAAGSGASFGGAGGPSTSILAGLGSAGSAGGSGCGPAGATDQGVSASEIRIDIDVAELAGQAGNSLAGIPSAQKEEAMFQAAIDGLNASGGVRCRKVVAKYYIANPLDQPSEQAVCLRMVADHPFALLDEGLGSPVGAPTPRDCPPLHGLPEFGTLHLSQKELDQFSPYLIADGATAEGIVHDWVLAAHALNWFAGASKVGLLEQDCVPGLNGLTLGDLARVGIPSSKVVTFDFGCTNAIPPPQELEQAVLKFKTAGVTHVMDDAGIYENFFSKVAAAQNYKPHYSTPDEGTIALWDNRDFGPDPANFSGALAITDTQYGAENTPGTSFNAETAACDKTMAKAGLPAAERSPDGFSGVACTLVNLFAAAAGQAPNLRRTELASGLASVRQLTLPFPIGPANLLASHGAHGGGFWRADTWATDCACFRVTLPTFAPSFG
jgi:hypothetical protein